VTQSFISRVVLRCNNIPRKSLSYQTPIEYLIKLVSNESFSHLI